MNDSNAEHDVREALRGPPSGYFVVVPQPQTTDAVDLGALVAVVLRSWKLLLGTAFIAALLTAVVSLQMREMYRAQALVAPVMQSSAGAAGALRNQLGGIAALMGIDLGSGGGRKEESFATLASTGFAREFIMSEKLMPILFAERWDSKANNWRAGEDPPTVEEAVRKFTKRVRRITEDRKTGLVTVSMEWHSPELAARWANRMVDLANERLRNEATRNAERSIDYLNRELAKTNVVDLREAIYRLIESQVNNAMLANVQREYAFRFIDAAVPPETRVSPKRTVMVIVGAFAGLFLGLIFVFVRRLPKAVAHSVTAQPAAKPAA